MKPRVSILGAGRMGSALARAFLKQGYETTVWNRTKSKCEPLAELGAQIAPSVLDAVAAAEVVVVNVTAYVTSDRLLRPHDVTKALRGKLVVQVTSGSPRQAREMAAWAGKNGSGYLDGAIMATPDLIGGSECTILYSGAADLFEKYKPFSSRSGETLSTWKATWATPLRLTAPCSLSYGERCSVRSRERPSVKRSSYGSMPI